MQAVVHTTIRYCFNWFDISSVRRLFTYFGVPAAVDRYRFLYGFVQLYPLSHPTTHVALRRHA